MGIARLLARAAGRVPNEPAGPSAVNRAYYAAYSEASDYAARIGYTHSGGAGSPESGTTLARIAMGTRCETC